jgi:hypothetical protein
MLYYIVYSKHYSMYVFKCAYNFKNWTSILGDLVKLFNGAVIRVTDYVADGEECDVVRSRLEGDYCV